MHEPRKATTFALLSGLALACATCAPAKNPQESPPVSTRPSLRHATHAAHLREMMAELDYLTGSRLPEDLKAGVEERERLEDVEYVSEALAQTAIDITEVLDEVRMTPVDQAHFRELANRLKAEALDLKARVARGELHDPEEALARITATCDACHKAFRVIPSDLDRAER
jgi:cytochrome c556